MDGKDRLAIGASGTAVGAFAMYYSIRQSRSALYNYFDNDVRTQVNKSCGSSMNVDQFHQLQQTDDWRQFRSPLPNIGSREVLKKLFGPAAMFYAATLLSGFTLDLGLSTFFKNDDLTNGPMGLAIGFTFAVMVLGRLWFFNYMQKGFVKIDNMSYYSGVCVEARKLSAQNRAAQFFEPQVQSPPVEIEAAEPDEEITEAPPDTDITDVEDPNMDAAEYEIPPVFFYEFEPIPAAI